MFRSPIILTYISLLLVFTSCSIAQVPEQENQYSFPLERLDVEKVLNEKGLAWTIENAEFKDSQSIYTFKNDDNIFIGMNTMTNDYGNTLNMTWSLPSNLPSDKFNEFYNTELPELYKVASIFYGNSNELDKSFDDFLDYYSQEERKGDVLWTKRIKENHLMIEIKPWLNTHDNRLGSLMLTTSEAYENYLNLLDESWRKTAEIRNIEIIDSTVKEISELNVNTNSTENQPKHFRITGHLKEIKKINNIPEAFAKIDSTFLKENKDNYLNAKLVDETGEIDVFVQTTSLNYAELQKEREHNAIVFFNSNNPVIVIRYSVLKD